MYRLDLHVNVIARVYALDELKAETALTKILDCRNK
jgi:hypothetical protein